MDDYINNKWLHKNKQLLFLMIYSIFFIGLSIFIIYKGLDFVKQKEINYINRINSFVNYY